MTSILSCMPPLEGWILLIVLMSIIAIVRLKPLRCPKCGRLMHQYSNNQWYCSRCKKWQSASDIYFFQKKKKEQKWIEKNESLLKQCKHKHLCPNHKKYYCVNCRIFEKEK